MRLAIDSGGTFTDIVSINDAGELEINKVPSGVPGDPSGILEGIDVQCRDMSEVNLFVHGTTYATNALIEKNGANCALIATDGFRDLLEIRRGHRPKEGMLSIDWDAEAPLIQRRFRFTVRERLNYRGDVLVPLQEEDVLQVLEQCAANNISAIAVCLVNSFKNPEHELRIGELIAQHLPDAYVTLSHQLTPSIREFERTSTTVANVFVGPQMKSYLSGLKAGCEQRGYKEEILVMQSHGGCMSTQYASLSPVRAANSGPVAGVISAARIGAQIGKKNLVSFDMGGTSADISVVVDGAPVITDESQIEFGMPVLFPSVLIDTIGAGGGSIAWVDKNNRLCSGPRSAGAHPGPACYMRGGVEPTTTDAHVVLGNLSQNSLLAGEMDINETAAGEAVDRVAAKIGTDRVTTAAGIIQITNSIMERGLRRMTLEQGHDPRDMCLVAFGGAGPLHAAALAKSMHIPEVLVPLYPGVHSAMGLLHADLRHDHLETFGIPVALLEPEHLKQALKNGMDQVTQRLLNEGIVNEDINLRLTLHIKYAGGIEPQAMPIVVEYSEAIDRAWIDSIAQKYHAARERLYKSSASTYPVEIESLRVEGVGQIRAVKESYAPKGKKTEITSRSVYFVDSGQFLETRIIQRATLATGATIAGPAIIEQFDTTTVIEPQMHARIDEYGNIRINVFGEK